MPIELIDLTTPPGSIVQRCATCDSLHEIRLDRGAAETKPGPFATLAGDTLLVRVDGGEVQTVTFGRETLAAGLLRGRLTTALTGVRVELNGDAVLIESDSTGAASRVEIVGGTARLVMVAGAGEWQELAAGRPVLGVSIGDLTNDDAILLRRCGCGAQETLVRTWDEAPSNVVGSKFDRHRRAVNGLAQYFLDSGWVHAEVAATLRTESPRDVVDLRAGQRLEV